MQAEASKDEDLSVTILHQSPLGGSSDNTKVYGGDGTSMTVGPGGDACASPPHGVESSPQQQEAHSTLSLCQSTSPASSFQVPRPFLSPRSPLLCAIVASFCTELIFHQPAQPTRPAHKDSPFSINESSIAPRDFPTIDAQGRAHVGDARRVPCAVSHEEQRKIRELNEARYGSIKFVHQDNLLPSCSVINDALRHYGLPGDVHLVTWL